MNQTLTLTQLPNDLGLTSLAQDPEKHVFQGPGLGPILGFKGLGEFSRVKGFRRVQGLGV